MSRQDLYDSNLYDPVLHNMKLGSQAMTMAGNLTLADGSPGMLFLDPGGSARTVLLPAEAANKNRVIAIVNKADGVGENLTVQEDSGTTSILVVEPQQVGFFFCDGTAWHGGAMAHDVGAAALDIGAIASQPVSGTIAADIRQIGAGFFRLDFTLTAAQIPVTDAAGSGSFGTLKLFDFVEGAVCYIGCRQNYTDFVEGAALTGEAGDAVFEIGVGTAAIGTAADGALGATEDDIGGDVNIDLGAASTGTGVNQSAAVVDGTTTATDINLNWSGTAATIDADSTIDVDGTISVIGAFMGDD